jgi:hypothetical protein
MSEAIRHQCMIYEGLPVAHLPRLAPILLKKLSERHRCMFLGSPTVTARMRLLLAEAGCGVSEEIKRGALVLSADQSHLAEGVFDPDKMLSMLAQAVDKALEDGFKGLWATGDMTWEFGREENLPKLLQYECGLEKLFRIQPALSGICQYHKDTLPLDMIGNALYTHQAIYINHTLQRVNPFYLQPNTIKINPPRRKPADIEHMLREALGSSASGPSLDLEIA